MAGESHEIELLLMGMRGTKIALREREATPRASCPLAPGAGQPIVEIVNGAGVEVQFVALASDAQPAADEAAPSGAVMNGVR